MKKAPVGRFFVLKCKMRRRQKAGEGRAGERKAERRKCGAKEMRSEGKRERGREKDFSAG